MKATVGNRDFGSNIKKPQFLTAALVQMLKPQFPPAALVQILKPQFPTAALVQNEYSLLHGVLHGIKRVKLNKSLKSGFKSFFFFLI